MGPARRQLSRIELSAPTGFQHGPCSRHVTDMEGIIFLSVYLHNIPIDARKHKQSVHASIDGYVLYLYIVISIYWYCTDLLC